MAPCLKSHHGMSWCELTFTHCAHGEPFQPENPPPSVLGNFSEIILPDAPSPLFPLLSLKLLLL